MFKKIGRILVAEIVIFLLAVLVYRIQLDGYFDDNIFAGLEWDHKDNYEYVMSAENPVAEEDIYFGMREIKTIAVTGRADNIDPDTHIEFTVINKATGEVQYSENHLLKDVLGPKDRDYVMYVDSAKCSEGEYIIRVSLIDCKADTVTFAYNLKYSIVKAFNSDPQNKINIITKVTYGQVRSLTKLYFIVVFIIMLVVLLCFMHVMRHGIVAGKGFLPILLLLGLCYQILIPVGGAPDESWHIDTAYKYSNYMMMVPSTGNVQTLYKRECDAQQSDLLGNNVETNSFWQLLENTFVRPDNTELIEVGYVDASGNAPGIVYFPMALGITIGRLLGLSGMLTYILGRYLAFVCSAVLMYAAILIAPYGKNVIALISVLPITIQQCGSASYDALLIGAGMFYTACCLRVMEKDSRRKDIIPAAISGLLIVITKGGVYSPLLIFLIYALYQRNAKKEKKGLSKRTIILLLVGAALLVAGIIFIYKDIFAAMNVADRTSVSTERTYYTISYFISNPTELVCIYWNTLIHNSDDYVLGLMGGKLGWNSIELNWFFVLPLVLVMLLFANVENDKMNLQYKKRVVFLVPCVLSYVAILLALLLAYTRFGNVVVKGVQGRYFLPFAAMLFIMTENRMVNVDKAASIKLWKFTMYLQSLMIMQIVVNAWK